MWCGLMALWLRLGVGLNWKPVERHWSTIMMGRTDCSVLHRRNLRAQWCTTLPMESRWDVCFVCLKAGVLPSCFAVRPLALDAGFVNFSFFLFIPMHSRDQRRATPPMMRRKWKVGKVLKCFTPFFLFLSTLSFSVSHLVKCVYLTVVTGRCAEILHVSLTLLTVCLWCVYVCIYRVSGCVLCVCSSGQFGAESEQRHRGDAPTSALTSKFTCQ